MIARPPHPADQRQFLTEPIKFRLLQGGYVHVPERQCGKTTAILEAVKHFGPENCLVIVPSQALARHTENFWCRLYGPKLKPPFIRAFQRDERYLRGLGIARTPEFRVFYDEMQLMKFRPDDRPGMEFWSGGPRLWWAGIGA